MQDAPQILRRLFDVAVSSCHPRAVVRETLPDRPQGRIVVVGAGKASAAMAAEVEAAWSGPLSGLVVTGYGHSAPTRHIEVVEARHPLPDEAGLLCASRALGMVHGLHENDMVLALMSGGGSALWCAPLPPLTLLEKQSITQALVLSGASIDEINCVRKHLSAIKGGRLAASAYPAKVVTLAISDVASNDPSVIASGPTVADHTRNRDAMHILEKYRVPVSATITALLGERADETIQFGDPRLDRSTFRIIASSGDALAAACDEAHRLGLDTKILGVNIEGNAKTVARAHAEIAQHQTLSSRPLLLLSGGELTVQVQGQGHGGPNREYLLALARGLNGAQGIWALAADTDGIDGSDGIAGGWIGPETLSRAQELGVDPAEHLRDNNSAAFFETLGQQIETGPTRTNVNDFRAILLAPSV